MNKLSFRAPLVVALTAAALVRPAHAQEAPRELEQVTVTATKVVQSLERAPASITSIGEEFARERAVSGFQELSDYVPNVTMNVSGSAGQFVVRGLGTPDTNLGFDPSVGTVIDGVYYGRANFLSAFFNDLDRYEVLRGPQGTLFGKNSTAGLFNVVTNKPDSENWKLDGEMLARGYGDLSVRPALNIPVGHGFGLRLSGNFTNGDRNTLYNTKLKRPEENESTNSLRARLRYAGDAGLVADFSAVYSQLAQNNSNFQLYRISPEMEATIRDYDPDYDDDLDHRKNSTNFPGEEKARIQSYALTVEMPLPSFGGIENFRVTSVSAWAESLATKRDIDADFTPIPFINDRLVEPSRYQQTSQEVRFTGSGKDLFGYGHGINFIAGIYLLGSSYGASDLFTLEDLGGALAYCTAAPVGVSNCLDGIPGGIGGIGSTLAGPISTLLPLLDATGINNQNVRARLQQSEQTYAGFGQFEYNFLPKWALIGGVRYGSQEKKGVLSAQATRLCPPGIEPGTPAYEQCPSIIEQIAGSEDHTTYITRNEGDYSPKGGLRFSPSRQVSHYFTWARGYKSGGFNGLPLRSTENEFGPERASSYEFGTKARLFKGRMRVSGSAFFTDFKNLQLSTFKDNRFIVFNAGTAESRGGEIDFQWLPEALPFLLFRSSVGYADARYKNYQDGPCYADTEPGCTPNDPPDCPKAEGSNDCAAQDMSGRQLPYAPRWTSAISPNFFFPLGNGLRGSLGLDWVYRSARFLDVDLDPRKKQGATQQFNAFLLINDASQRWTINLGIRNITDTRFYDQILSQPLAPGNLAAAGINEPRTFTQSISFAF